MTLLEKIVSGGQTGADRAALDFAIEHGIPHGGWCPKGRKSEDGPIDLRYQLKETPSSGYAQRTEWNVRDSDGTVVFSIAPQLAGGSKKAENFARRHHRPILHLWRDSGPPFPEVALLQFILDQDVKVLNVAGPRASEEPEIAAFVTQVLEKVFEAPTVEQPTLETARLLLRPLSSDDAPSVARLAGRREIADTTLSIPHPYSEQQASDWISRHSATRSGGKEMVFAVVTKKDMELVGTAGLRDLDCEHGQAEMGFWIAVDCWGRGYATEAAQTLLRFGFTTLRLNRIYAHFMLRNPASGRVLKKIGMKEEGILRERVRKWGVFEDVAILSILRKEWPVSARPL